MLAATLNIECSKRCESFIAMAILFSPQRVIELADCLVQDRSRAALSLADAVSQISESTARDLAIATLAPLGFMVEK